MTKEATILKKRVRRLRAILFQVGERSDLPSCFPLSSDGQAVHIGTKNKNGSVGPFIEILRARVTSGPGDGFLQVVLGPHSERVKSLNTRLELVAIKVISLFKAAKVEDHTTPRQYCG